MPGTWEAIEARLPKKRRPLAGWWWWPMGLLVLGLGTWSVWPADELSAPIATGNTPITAEKSAPQKAENTPENVSPKTSSSQGSKAQSTPAKSPSQSPESAERAAESAPYSQNAPKTFPSLNNTRPTPTLPDPASPYRATGKASAGKRLLVFGPKKRKPVYIPESGSPSPAEAGLALNPTNLPGEKESQFAQEKPNPTPPLQVENPSSSQEEAQVAGAALYRPTKTETPTEEPAASEKPVTAENPSQIPVPVVQKVDSLPSKTDTLRQPDLILPAAPSPKRAFWLWAEASQTGQAIELKPRTSEEDLVFVAHPSRSSLSRTAWTLGAGWSLVEHRRFRLVAGLSARYQRREFQVEQTTYQGQQTVVSGNTVSYQPISSTRRLTLSDETLCAGLGLEGTLALGSHWRISAAGNYLLPWQNRKDESGLLQVPDAYILLRPSVGYEWSRWHLSFGAEHSLPLTQSSGAATLRSQGVGLKLMRRLR